ncbi:hypothetical protein TNCV_3082061 [Trichonephila clavipes]|nr:hypothetical protein TNCV_3082061 [Trichonephila clavipes]
MLPKKIYQERYEASSVHKTRCALSKRHKRENVLHATLKCHRIRNTYIVTSWASSGLDNGCHMTRHRFKRLLETFLGNDLPTIGQSCP